MSSARALPFIVVLTLAVTGCSTTDWERVGDSWRDSVREEDCRARPFGYCSRTDSP